MPRRCIVPAKDASALFRAPSTIRPSCATGAAGFDLPLPSIAKSHPGASATGTSPGSDEASHSYRRPDMCRLGAVTM